MPKGPIPRVRQKRYASLPRKHIEGQVRSLKARTVLVELDKGFRDFIIAKRHLKKHERGDTLKLLKQMERIWRLNIPLKLKYHKLRRRAEFIWDGLLEAEREQGKPVEIDEAKREDQILQLMKSTRPHAIVKPDRK